MTPLMLKVGGKVYSGWEALSVQTGIEQLAGQFSLHCADRWAIAGQKRPMVRGQAASIEIAGHPVITGRLDATAPEFDPEHHELVLEGRDATGDLVDCAAETDGQGWSNRTLEQVAIQLCKPFGVPVTIDGASGPGFKRSIFDKTGKVSARNPFRTLRINPGETVHQVLSRAAQLRGYLLVSDGLGGLRITRAGAGGKARTLLRHPGNIIGGRQRDSEAERFHTYKIFGQANQAFSFGTQQEQLLATATDAAIRASRVTVITTSEDVDATSAQALADWTAANRLARGIEAYVLVRGWLDVDTPWRHNMTVDIDCPWLDLHGEYLISSVQFQVGLRVGQVATLGLTLPAAYVPAPANEVDEVPQ